MEGQAVVITKNGIIQPSPSLTLNPGGQKPVNLNFKNLFGLHHSLILQLFDGRQAKSTFKEFFRLLNPGQIGKRLLLVDDLYNNQQSPSQFLFPDAILK